ncbi:protein of unknown function [Pseudomonas inefficax]|uniref:Uncharacterized protein n=1 Tax=Pseudomonas inefficax TaxID=2078786 RepID=A0AAQ1SS16_9PSED|nr:protein of unknown function [Pseudomonas inefficax]
MVRDHPHDLRGLGILHGLPGQADQALSLQASSQSLWERAAREEAGTVHLTSGVSHALCIRPFCTKNELSCVVLIARCFHEPASAQHRGQGWPCRRTEPDRHRRR